MQFVAGAMPFHRGVHREKNATCTKRGGRGIGERNRFQQKTLRGIHRSIFWVENRSFRVAFCMELFVVLLILVRCVRRFGRFFSIFGIAVSRLG
ncbi:MAG TPA: hypothetical protein PLJ47_14875, partial [Candidatus Hydrogenedentes bacterium]|nr:hypothetical protein [Candidatus Hydrogenedentota bacterium]